MRMSGYGLIMAAALAAPGAARADVVSVRLWSPGTVEIQPSQIGASKLQVERFDRLPAGTSGPVQSSFGGGPFGGTYGGDFQIMAANQYGGAGGTGTYIASARPQSGFTLNLTHTAAVPGVNFFGLDLTALDAGNTLSFLRGGNAIATYTGADLAAIFGPCTAGGYCGNPTTRQDQGEAFGFLGFTDQTGFIDQVRFDQTTSGGLFESDNHTLAYVTPAANPTTVAVPEPGSIALMVAFLASLGVLWFAHSTVGTLGSMVRLDKEEPWS